MNLRNRVLPSSRRRALLAAGIFSVWVLLAGATMWELGKLPCGIPRSIAASDAWPEGDWRVRHWFADQSAGSRAVMAHLMMRGPESQLDEVVCLMGPAQAWAPAFRAAGWRVEFVAQSQPAPRVLADAEAWLDLGESDQIQLWQARHDFAALAEDGAVPLDLIAIRAVLNGWQPPPVVPAGCSI